MLREVLLQQDSGYILGFVLDIFLVTVERKKRRNPLGARTQPSYEVGPHWKESKAFAFSYNKQKLCCSGKKSFHTKLTVAFSGVVY